ncbi:unnamed protein product [Ranitomeya imitator]|uniref:Uncharacterized protein n=1 Tax=Ranitomeya imitator TaxID=111125 RepID=A0ABN9M454_9NEOB|nr:unnamed protein product [Ranitomeya imitator]
MPISVRTWKTAFLVAITTAKRVGEIQALSIKDPYLQVREDHIILKLDPAFIPKIASAKNRDQEIILPSFCENPSNEKEQALHSLDVRQAVLNYLEATSSWRKDSNLFILFGETCKCKNAAKYTGADVRTAKIKDAGLILADTLRKFLFDLNVDDGLAAVGYSTADIPALVKGTLPQERVTKLSPRLHSEEDLSKLFEASMKLY